MKQLQLLQNRALRICLKCNIMKYHVEELHTICNVEMIQRRYDKLLLSLMYTRSSKLPGARSIEDVGIVTRAQTVVQFTLPRQISHFYKKAPFYRGVVLWNLVPVNIQRATSKVKFKFDIAKIKDLRASMKKGYN